MKNNKNLTKEINDSFEKYIIKLEIRLNNRYKKQNWFGRMFWGETKFTEKEKVLSKIMYNEGVNKGLNIGLKVFKGDSK